MRRGSPILGMALIFILVQSLALLLAPLFPTEYRAFEDVGDPLNPIFFLILLLLITGLVLLLIRLRRLRFIQLIFLFAVFSTGMLVFLPLLYLVIPIADLALILSIVLASVLVALLVIRPEWYVINLVGVILGAGVGAILGMSLGILPAMILLIALAVYDAISVYKTKHMITLAEGVTSLKLPVLFVVPKKRGFSMHSLEDKQITEEGEEREAMFMGVGDAAIPAVLVVSSLMFLPGEGATAFPNLLVALGTMAGSFIGCLVLMRMVMKGRPQAGLPLLNGGAILGYIITYLIVFRDLGLGLL